MIVLPDPLTYGAMIDLANKVTTQDEAGALLGALVERAMRDTPTLSEAEALRMCRSNLGYLAGYCNIETQRRWETLFGAVHPVFGPVGGDKEPKTIAETFRMGVDAAKKMVGP